MIAAMMTAANLGARITGWGFVVFTIGSVAWTTVGLSSGQANLVASNAFLTVVNLVGIWRWLGRQRVYETGAATGGIGGVAEELRAVARNCVRFECDRLHLSFGRAELCALAPLDGGDWPGDVHLAHGRPA